MKTQSFSQCRSISLSICTSTSTNIKISTNLRQIRWNRRTSLQILRESNFLPRRMYSIRWCVMFATSRDKQARLYPALRKEKRENEKEKKQDRRDTNSSQSLSCSWAFRKRGSRTETEKIISQSGIISLAQVASCTTAAIGHRTRHKLVLKLVFLSWKKNRRPRRWRSSNVLCQSWHRDFSISPGDLQSLVFSISISALKLRVLPIACASFARFKMKKKKTEWKVWEKETKNYYAFCKIEM